ncbi:hypothetical protein CCR75_007125 [Bremia lactucae]|uniref:C2H2-type domain-containing protein n=1 Tax=Bremia lactucae TaxID=4779 RepID=A0A976IBZ7_BRELC|nr:hypothetical protein CCR75_007125 [Bremia lactucae]
MAPSCVLCCNDIDNKSRFNTVGVCNHYGCCSICALRLRQLLGQTACVVCKTDMPRVICVIHEDASFESFQDWGDNIGPAYVYDEQSAMFFFKENYMQHIRKLRDPICPKCGKSFATVEALRTHVLNVHDLQYCSICLEHKKVFIGELGLFTKEGLKKHHLKGSRYEGFIGHPRCDFCFSRFYSTTELYEHLRKHHFECDLCLYHFHVQNRYYKDYPDLENHFRADHYLCEEPSCLEKKFVVFPSHLDLQAHLTVDHPHIKTSRKINVHFTIRRASSQNTNSEVEDSQLIQSRSGTPTINVADFPSLSGSESAIAGPTFSLWENQSVSNRRNGEDFPALASSVSNPSHSYQTAVIPPLSAAVRAHLNTNQWTYENPDLASAAAVLGANNPLLKVLKPARKNLKGKKKGRPNAGLNEKVAALMTETNPLESKHDESSGNPSSKSALVLKIRQVLGSDAKYEVFREHCKRFRLHQLHVPEFYAIIRAMLSQQAFHDLFLPLMRLSPDHQQVETFFAYHQERSQNHDQNKTTPKVPKTLSKKNKKPMNLSPERSNVSLSHSGWGNAMKESGVSSALNRHASASVHNSNVGSILRREMSATSPWNSSNQWQTSTRAASTEARAGHYDPSTSTMESYPSLHPTATSLSTELRTGASLNHLTTPLPSSRELLPPSTNASFKVAKHDFPELPKASRPLGVQAVTRATWDDQVQAIAQHRSSSTWNASRDTSKKKHKKKNMTLQEMAMHFG